MTDPSILRIALSLSKQARIHVSLPTFSMCRLAFSIASVIGVAASQADNNDHGEEYDSFSHQHLLVEFKKRKVYQSGK